MEGDTSTKLDQTLLDQDSSSQRSSLLLPPAGGQQTLQTENHTLKYNFNVII